MVHKKIIEAALANLDADRSEYFHALVDALEKDPRLGDNANLVYLVLKETMHLLPMYLQRGEVLDLLFVFVKAQYGSLRKILYDEAFVHNPKVILDVTNLFVEQVVDATMARYEDGELEVGEAKVQKFTWPYRAEDLVDPDDDDADLEGIKAKAASYDGPDRRRR